MVAARAPDYLANATTRPILEQNQCPRPIRREIRRPTRQISRIRVRFENCHFIVIVEVGATQLHTQLNAYKKVAGEAFLNKNSALLCSVVNAMMKIVLKLPENEAEAYWVLICAYLQELRQLSKAA
ncbi:MAG: hypothetical protein ACOZBH_01730 [Patescibacteria group bacterium]